MSVDFVAEFALRPFGRHWVVWLGGIVRGQSDHDAAIRKLNTCRGQKIVVEVIMVGRRTVVRVPGFRTIFCVDQFMWHGKVDKT